MVVKKKKIREIEITFKTNRKESAEKNIRTQSADLKEFQLNKNIQAFRENKHIKCAEIETQYRKNKCIK